MTSPSCTCPNYPLALAIRVAAPRITGLTTCFSSDAACRTPSADVGDFGENRTAACLSRAICIEAKRILTRYLQSQNCFKAPDGTWNFVVDDGCNRRGTLC